MPKYTNIELLLKKAKGLAQTFSSSCLATVHIIKAIEDAPTVDVVEVVRCNDCVFGYYDTSACCYRCYATSGGLHRTVERNEYCSYGVRRAGEDE